MRAMVLHSPKEPLREENILQPKPGPGQVLVQIRTCAVCRTDLHVVDGELPHPKLPLIPGHEIVGIVTEFGAGVERFQTGDRVGVGWLGWTCGACDYCSSDRENLCEKARFTGYTLDGGYAEYTVADARFCFPLPRDYTDVSAAPLMCAGLIGYRSLKKAGNAHRIGIYGFGGAAHIITQVARYQGRKIFAFTRPGDRSAQQFARNMGAVWAGDSNTSPPEELDAAIIFASAGELVPQALKTVVKGGLVVCGGIHMSDIPSFSYKSLWHERTLCSVANLTRRDSEEFLTLAPKVPVRTETMTFPLAAANEALERLRNGKLDGAAVLIME